MRPSRHVPALWRIAGTAALSFSAPAFAQTPANLGFEAHDAAGHVTGWGINGVGFQIAVDSTAPFAGRFSLRTRWIDSAAYVPNAGKFGMGIQAFPLAYAIGRRLHLSGYIRTTDIRTGYAGFWMRVDGFRKSLQFDNMNASGPRGTTPWTRYEIELPVDSGATQVVFGVLHSGDGTAWFDSVSLAVVGPAMPRTVASWKPDVRPAEDMTRLLSDAELAAPPDSIPVPENPVWSDWVRTNAHPVRSLGATDFADLRFLAPLLSGKRIVQLGESGHGVAEFDMAKVRLVKYLHEELGYDVMAFESSTYECERAERRVATLSAIDLMRSCIFGVWHTSETLPLFEYIKQTQSTAHPLILAGFDEQTSTASASGRPAFFRGLIAPIDTAYAAHVYAMDSVFLAKYRAPGSIGGERDRLVAFYDSLATFFRANRRAIETAHRDDANAAVIARQAAISMTVFTRQIAAGVSTEVTEIRDRGMADNLDFLLNELYPGKKFIAWAHNFHIQRRGAASAGIADSARKPAPRSMGVWVAERHRSELYTIGLFMYRGAAAQNDRSPYAIATMRTGGLESILHRAPARYSFVDFSQAPRGPGTEWMWTRITGMDWGTQPLAMVPRDEYDGVLFVDTTHPPHYLPFATGPIP